MQTIPAIRKNVLMKQVMPDTVRDFQCIMGACEDNCCRNTTWRITVDKDSYKKYEGLDSDVGRRILDCIEGVEPNYSFKEFGDGKCALMLDSGLCYIHKELGAEYLCNTCATYPRNHHPFNKSVEYWLSLSCPEVVRHVLYRKKSTSYVEAVYSYTQNYETKPQDEDKALIRGMLVKIASYRKLTLKEKIMYMGLFMRSVGKLSVYAPDYKKLVRKTIKNYTNGLGDARKSLGEVVRKLGGQSDAQRLSILLVISVLAHRVTVPPKIHPHGIENEKYYTLMGSYQNEVKDNVLQNYLLRTFDEKIVPYVNSRPHVFENYLIYVLMSSRFMSDSNDYAACFTGFGGELLTMLAFACMFHEYENFGDEEMVATIYLFHRRVSHSPVLRRQLAEKFTNDMLVFLLCALGGIK